MEGVLVPFTQHRRKSINWSKSALALSSIETIKKNQMWFISVELPTIGQRRLIYEHNIFLLHIETELIEFELSVYALQ